MNWSQVKDIVAGALSQPESERAAYLNEQCGADTAMRSEVESLLAAAVQAADLYEDLTVLVAGEPMTSDALADLAPETRDTRRHRS